MSNNVPVVIKQDANVLKKINVSNVEHHGMLPKKIPPPSNAKLVQLDTINIVPNVMIQNVPKLSVL